MKTNAKDGHTQAIILVGGKGTRIRSKFPGIPKPLVPVNGTPFLELQVAWLCRQGCSRFHLAAGYKATLIDQWASDYQERNQGIVISTSTEPEPLGTAGGLKWIEDRISSDPFLLLNGDSLLPELDINALLATHAAGDAAATLAVTHIEEAGRFGTVEFEDNTGLVTAFREKASRESGWVNGGIYVMSRGILAAIPENTKMSLEQDLFPDLIGDKRLYMHKTAPPLLDMGTPDGLTAMSVYLETHPVA